MTLFRQALLIAATTPLLAASVPASVPASASVSVSALGFDGSDPSPAIRRTRRLARSPFRIVGSLFGKPSDDDEYEFEEEDWPLIASRRNRLERKLEEADIAFTIPNWLGSGFESLISGLGKSPAEMMTAYRSGADGSADGSGDGNGRRILSDETHENDTDESDTHEDSNNSHEDSNNADDSHGDGHTSLGTHVAYEDIYYIMVFLSVMYGAGLLAEILGMPSLVGNIISGFILGPPFLDMVPFPEAMVLVGEIGLIMLLLEAGVEVDVNQLKQTGGRALAMAMTGTVLPLCTALGLGVAYGLDVKSALAIGMAFSPTSLGVASSALTAGGIADAPMGQLVCAACVFDDIIALILLAMLEVLVKTDAAIIEFFYPLMSGIGFLLLLGGIAVTVAPGIIENKFLHSFPERYHDTAMFCLMAVLTMAYMPLLYYTKGSYLSGAFCAGLNFAQVPHAHHTFLDNVHQTMAWLMRVFFAASIGFQIPVKYFNSGSVIGWGFIFYAAVLMKLPLAFFVPPFQDKAAASKIFNPHTRDKVLTALAMSCRGEFSFIIASFALGQGLFEPETYASIVWAVLFSAITSPFLLLQGIKYYNKKQKLHMEIINPLAGAGRSTDGTMPAYIQIIARTKIVVGLNEILIGIARELELEVVDFRTSSKRGVDAIMTSDLYVMDPKLRVKIPTISKLREIQNAFYASCHHLQELMERPDPHVAMTKGMSMRNSLRNSIEQLDKLNESMRSNEEEFRLLRETAKENDVIKLRCKCIQKAFLEKLDMGNDATMTVTQWDPFDWMAALDSLADHNRKKNDSDLDVNFFMALFDVMDEDNSGHIDQAELLRALKKSGITVSQLDVEAMMTVIDEDGDREIDRNEWRAVCQYYLEDRGHTSGGRSILGVPTDRAKAVADARKRVVNDANRRASEENERMPAEMPRTNSVVSFHGADKEDDFKNDDKIQEITINEVHGEESEEETSEDDGINF